MIEYTWKKGYIYGCFILSIVGYISFGMFIAFYHYNIGMNIWVYAATSTFLLVGSSTLFITALYKAMNPKLDVDSITEGYIEEKVSERLQEIKSLINERTRKNVIE